MNAVRGRGPHRGRGRNGGGYRGWDRGLHRNDSDSQRTTALPPGLRIPASHGPHQPSNSLPNASGWDLSEDNQQNTGPNQPQAAVQAADHAVEVPTPKQNQHRGDRSHRRSSGDWSRQYQANGQEHGQSSHSRHGVSSSVPGNSGRANSGTPHAQSKVVAIPQRYVNSSGRLSQSPASGQQAAGQNGTPISRSRYGWLQSYALWCHSAMCVSVCAWPKNQLLRWCIIVPFDFCSCCCTQCFCIMVSDTTSDVVVMAC